LQKALKVSGIDTVVDDKREEVCAEDSQHAADRGTNQPFEADRPESDLKDHDRNAEQCANRGIHCRKHKRKRLQKITGDCNNDDEYRTYDY
jgi:hypothetical protein